MTKIEWVKNVDGTQGKTWSPVTGCSKRSAGCANCWAERMARRLSGRFGYPEIPHHFDVTSHPDRLEQPLQWKKPQTIFVVSMGDLFHSEVPASFIVNIYEVMEAAKQHLFIVLTKRPERIIPVLYGEEGNYLFGGGDYLPNVWHLVTTENQGMADKRIPELLKLREYSPGWPVLGVSAEPLLGPLDLSYYLNACPEIVSGNVDYVTQEMALDAGDPSMEGMELHAEPEWTQTCQPLNYVIAGGESGHGARIMPIQAARSLRDQCNEAGIPFLFKQHGMYLHTSQMVRGVHFGENESRPTGDHYVKCTSKHWAGRLLDGVIHDDMPLMIKS